MTLNEYCRKCKNFDPGKKCYNQSQIETFPSDSEFNGETGTTYYCHAFIPRSDMNKIKNTVNHPSHYNQGKVECIDAIEAATVGKTGIEAVCVSNIIKYLFRYETKNGLTDVHKAQWYLQKLIEVIENKNETK